MHPENRQGSGKMKVIGLVAAAALALSLAGQTFAEDVDSAHDCVEKGGHMDAGKCVGVPTPAAATNTAGGSLSNGAIVGGSAILITAIAISVAGKSHTTHHGTGGTTN
jgi:hypothetical protein